QQKYLDLEEKVKEVYPDCEVFISFSSRMVIKLLQKEKQETYKNLPQTLADVDMQGFKHIVVASVNIYPTDEHEFLKKIVDGFRHFSLANIGITNAINISQNHSVIRALEENNRTIAMNGLKTFSDIFKKNTDYKNIKVHIHDANVHSFLRAWKPEKHGDDSDY
ncbi:MAG: sirohydrochlorin cobaltochelatase, partial [Sulfurimonas sp.]